MRIMAASVPAAADAVPGDVVGSHSVLIVDSTRHLSDPHFGRWCRLVRGGEVLSNRSRTLAPVLVDGHV
jgi:hypothetical protein